MAYPQDTYLKAQEILQRRREKANAEQDRRKAKLYAKYPRLEEIQLALNRIGLSISTVIFQGGDAKTAMQELSVKSLTLQEEKEEILRQAGLPKDYLAVHYACDICNDTGVAGDRLCVCHKQILKDVERQRIQQVAPIHQCTFAAFDLGCYPAEKNGSVSPRELAESVLNGCKRYCSSFNLQSPNLLLIGGTGLGKTHLSLAIANSVIDRGYGVVYGSSSAVFNDLEAVRFNRNVSYIRYEERAILDADLFILDDLGTEFVTPFTISCLYNLVNARILSGKPTIISTNLSIADLERTYDQRITSRLTSDYTMLRFMGDDIRRIKKKL